MGWIRRLFSRERLEADLDKELRFHFENQVADKVRSGIPESEARRLTRIEFGGIEQIKEDCRERRGTMWLESLLQDLRYALRMFAKSPGFSGIAILTMALGIGATTAIFSLVNVTLLHPLRYPHPGELVRIEGDLPGAGAMDVGVSIPEFKDLQRSGIFQYVVLQIFGSANLTGASQPSRIQYEGVSPGYFAMLGVKPELGHTFDPQDQTPGFTLDVVISDGAWKRVFGSDPHIVGKSLRLDNDLNRVIGVMPPGFRDPGRTVGERNTELWAATGFSGNPAPPPNRSLRVPLETVGRLKPGLTLQAAQSQLDALVASLRKQFPDDYPADSRWTVRLVPLKENVVGNIRQPLILLFGAVALVLLIGCVNVANLLLARASARSREMAVRQALGAARKRLVRQLLTESLLLSLLGGVAGLAILFCMKGFLLRLIPESLPRLNDLSINWTVMLFALAASIAAGVIFGLAPARQAGRVDLAHTLRMEGRGSKGSTEQTRTRRVLVVTEFALSLVLMVAAGLLLRSFWDLYKAPLGFAPQQVMSVRLWLPSPDDPKADIYGRAGQEAVFARELLRRSRLLPGVREAALGSEPSIPLDHDRNLSPLIVEGRQTESKQPPKVERSQAGPEYFHLLGIPVLRGRVFNDGDNENAPLVAVINQAMAETYWRGVDPLGKRLKVGRGRAGVGQRASKTWVTIVGVVADARTESLANAKVPEIYLSLYQETPKELAIFLRGDLNASAIPEEVRAMVQSVDPGLPVYGAKTLDDAVSASLEQRRFSMDIVAAFAVTALLLAAMGIYGVISYIVSERTREIGIRLALGAQRGTIMGMVLRQGLGLAMAGAALGLVGSVIVSHLMAGLLYGVMPTDPLTFVGVTLVLTGVALAACYIPARRAIRVDPMIALRYE
ncbi:MAG TPA: ABC transporter permease [Acidobacteriaceae bacterium]|jgi:putative ABC transport system permease protein|nr:ABC transporter permease [Acidobacteriaceae bacterium]